MNFLNGSSILLLALFVLAPARVMAEEVESRSTKLFVKRLLESVPAGDVAQSGRDMEREASRFQKSMRRAAAAARKERLDLVRESKRRVRRVGTSGSGISCTAQSLDELCHRYAQVLSEELWRHTPPQHVMKPGEASVAFEVGPGGDYKVLRIVSATSEIHAMQALAIVAGSHVALPRGVTSFAGYQRFAFH